MKIGVLSDTHKQIDLSQKIIQHLVKNKAEFLIHAGDIVEPEILRQLKNSGLKYIAVYGNNDSHLAKYHNLYNLVQEPHHFNYKNTKFKLMHMPFYLSKDDADVVIFGHTHAFECEFKNNTLFLNPGEACARNKNLSECALLEITDKAYKVTRYNKKPKESKFNETKLIFEKTS